MPNHAPEIRRELILFLRKCASGGRGRVPVPLAVEAAQLLGWRVEPVVAARPVAHGRIESAAFWDAHSLVEHRIRGTLKAKARAAYQDNIRAPDRAFVIAPEPEEGAAAPSAERIDDVAQTLASSFLVTDSPPEGVEVGEVVLAGIERTPRDVLVSRAWIGTSAWRFEAPHADPKLLWRIWSPWYLSQRTELPTVEAPDWWTWAYRAGLQEAAARFLDAAGAASDPAVARDTTRPSKHARYCNVIFPGPLLIVRMPAHEVPWRVIVREVNRVVIALGYRARDVSAIEGLAGFPDADNKEEDERQRSRLGLAFAGNPEIHPRFYLYAWDDAAEIFTLARKPVNPTDF